MRTSVTSLLATALLIWFAGCTGNPPTPQPQVVVMDDPAPSQTQETVVNPTYKLWANFPAGTSVTQRTTTENADNSEKTVTTIVYTLKEKTDDHIVVESKARTVHYTGRVEENPPDTVKTRKVLSLPAGMKKEDWGKPKKGVETGEETITAAGLPYKSTWIKAKDFTEAGELHVKTWNSADMPGGLVKSVSTVPAKRATITVEVTEVTIPK